MLKRTLIDMKIGKEIPPELEEDMGELEIGREVPPRKSHQTERVGIGLGLPIRNGREILVNIGKAFHLGREEEFPQ